MNIQKTLNDVSGDLRIGDYLLPFIKTPANIIATGMDYAGMGIPKALVKTYQAFKTGDLKSPEYVRGMTRDLARAGLGLVGALLITSQLKDDDFVGAYDPNRAQIEQLRNSNYNAIRVGGKWISTDWLGPLMVPVTAMMYSRRYGKTWGEKKFLYAKGVLASAANIPGVSDIADAVRGIAYQKNQNLETLTGATADYITTTVYSRLVPSVLSDVARAIDPNVRQGGKGMGGVMSKIPFVSQTLPKKLDIFGNEIRSEGALSTLLFGSRVKTDKETEVVKEISRVSTVTDKGVAFTDWNKSSSKVLDQFKQRVGEKKFEDAKAKYGKELLRELTATLKNPIYKKLSDEDKLKVINGKDTDAMEMVFRQYGFKYRTLPTVRLPKNL